MDNMCDYIMFMFGEHPQQDKFIEFIANDLSVIADSENIKFYYGQTSAIFTFKSKESISEINEFLGIIFGDTNVVYVLLPYLSDKMSVKLPDGIGKHLFDINNSDTMSGFTTTAQESLTDKTNNLKNGLEFIKISDDEDGEIDDDYELFKLKNKKHEPSVDEILDKISEKGISSLSEKERNILEKYSKTI